MCHQITPFHRKCTETNDTKRVYFILLDWTRKIREKDEIEEKVRNSFQPLCPLTIFAFNLTKQGPTHHNKCKSK